MAGPTSKVLLLCGVCLVKQMSAGLERCRHSREESALQKEKDQNQIVLFSTKVHDVQIADFKKNRCCRPCTLRISLGLFDANFRNIQQRHAPAALRQPD